jgi:hypothetical protein
MINKIHCERHGNVILSAAETSAQLDNPNIGWYCPQCVRYGYDDSRVRWVNEYWECKCSTLVEMGVDVCPNCGFDAYAEYLASKGSVQP